MSSNCAEDARKSDTQLITVGTEVTVDDYNVKNLGKGYKPFTIKLTGTLSEDINKYVTVMVRGKNAGKFHTKNDGDFQVIIPGKYFTRGSDDYSIKFKLSGSKLYYFDGASALADVRR